MNDHRPHYLLFTDADEQRDGEMTRWHFVLEALDHEECINASDTEEEIGGERLELLAVIRGLEALDQPSRVTLVTPSRYVSRGLRFGLSKWRSDDWKWERHGWMVPVKNADLWQRLDRALTIHEVHCRQWRIDVAHGLPVAHLPKRATAAPPPADVAACQAHAASPPDPHERFGRKVPATRSRLAAAAIMRAVRDGVTAALQRRSQSHDFAAGSWSLAR